MWLIYLFTAMAMLDFGSALYPNKTRTIYFGAFVPYLVYFSKQRTMDKDRFGYKAAIDMAVEYVNNRSDILPDYKIKVDFGETFGQAPIALNTFIRFLTTGPKKIALLGPAYSAATYPVAEVATINAMVQVTYASLLPKLVNRFSYPYFFRSTPSVLAFNDAKIAWLKHFKWNRVGIIYDYSKSLFFQAIDRLQKNLKKQNFDVVSIEGFSSAFGATAANEVKRLKQLDARIIIAEVSKWGAQSVFCEAYKNKMYGDNYVWIVTASLVEDWYVETKPFNFCKNAELRTAVEGYFFTTRLDLRTDGKRSASGLNATEFLTELRRRSSTAMTYASFAFDAVWVLADSFHRIAKTRNLSQYTYKNYYVNYGYTREIQKTQFEGITGPLKFEKNSERLGFVRIGQFRNGTKHDVALHKPDGNITFYPGARKKLFNGKSPPFDHTVLEFIVYSLSKSVIAVLWSFAVFGLAISFFFLYFNIRYRENRLIKMSSPMINNVIIIGCLLCYAAVIVSGMDSGIVGQTYLPAMCTVFKWLLTIGFTLSFGALFSKTWRVYKIFTAARSMERVAILDRHLIVIILVLLGIDIVLLTVETIVAPYGIRINEVSRAENKLKDVIEVTQWHRCYSENSIYFSGAAIAYKGILLLFGLFLAWETRHVEVPALNDSKFIGMAVYNVAAISAIGATLSFALRDASSFETVFTIVSMCIILCTTVTLCLVFLPKLSLLFSKNASSATESAFSAERKRGTSTLSMTPASASREDLNSGLNGGERKIALGSTDFGKKSAMSSMTSISGETGVSAESYDNKAWAASTNEISTGQKNNDPFPGKSTNDAPPPYSSPRTSDKTDATQRVEVGLSFPNSLFGRNESLRQSISPRSSPSQRRKDADSSARVDQAHESERTPGTDTGSEDEQRDERQRRNGSVTNGSHHANLPNRVSSGRVEINGKENDVTVRMVSTGSGGAENSDDKEIVAAKVVVKRKEPVEIKTRL